MQTNNPKKLYLSRTDKIMAGVCGGFAAYFGIDASIARLGLLILTLATGLFPGVVVYIIAAVILPKEPV